ncbi:MAG TPA: phage holin family protein [Verrucomicrobiales bacterium]|nr:phage holin family protein [Verrucomicrobiales bacterium]
MTGFPVDERSLFQRIAAFRTAVASHLDARFQLLALEAEEARGLLARQLFLLGSAVLALSLGYLLVLSGGVALIAHLLQTPWWVIALAAGIAHLALGTLLFLLGRRPLARKLFPDSRMELEKDRQCLTHKH